jgi:hypothetical protein
LAARAPRSPVEAGLVRRPRRAARRWDHMWTAPWQAFCFGDERLAAFGHMSGLCWRGPGSAGPDEVRRPRLQIKAASSGLLTPGGVSDGLRSSRRVVHHLVVALAKRVSLRSPFECVAPDWDQALA